MSTLAQNKAEWSARFKVDKRASRQADGLELGTCGAGVWQSELHPSRSFRACCWPYLGPYAKAYVNLFLMPLWCRV